MIPYLTDGTNTVYLTLESVQHTPRVEIFRHERVATAKDDFTFDIARTKKLTLSGFTPSDIAADSDIAIIKNWYETNQGAATGNLYFYSDTIDMLNCFVSRQPVFTREFKQSAYYKFTIELTLTEPSKKIDSGTDILVFFEPWEDVPEPSDSLVFSEGWET